ncbi:hypothetical protein [Streptomyces sp. T12]|nr:hypothetical protein [Streptomyces sp. T12]
MTVCVAVCRILLLGMRDHEHSVQVLGPAAFALCHHSALDCRP